MNEKNRTHLLRSCAVTALLNQLSFESRRAGTPPQTKQLSPGSSLIVSCRTGAVKMIVPGVSCRRKRGQAELEKRCPRHNPIDHPRTQSIRPQIKCDRVVQVVDHSIDLDPDAAAASSASSGLCFSVGLASQILSRVGLHLSPVGAATGQGRPCHQFSEASDRSSALPDASSIPLEDRAATHV